MADPITLIALAGSGLTATAIAVFAGLRGWQGWLELKRFELTGIRGEPRSVAGERIEMADLKERIRKLEAIASGVDL
ncbi:hypothetical protein [Allosphingosinicella indica]|uniref:Uncharacterized protein n=1 Tax=Allosphingosinicella indica TaxID=941907 RepID=A0A1X7GIK9_9SPHN|nr:hypothetical protein [Allosphingosinicella indica]SMF70294.1 hypothetical protein SAMN06295910_1835 [Allosphingosinicella indica]